MFDSVKPLSHYCLIIKNRKAHIKLKPLNLEYSNGVRREQKLVKKHLTGEMKHLTSNSRLGFLKIARPALTDYKI